MDTDYASEDSMSLWIARRAPDRYAFPDRLDNMVAGGLPHGIGLNENLIKACREEADMPPEMAKQAKPVGSVSYQSATDLLRLRMRTIRF